MRKELVKSSRFLSKILRHNPEAVGITLNDKGWASVSEILKFLKIQKDDLIEIVDTNDKKRFEFDTHQKNIRARQGHSIDVDVELQEFIPNNFLYHGTASKSLDSIFEFGITKQSRNHVHLSDNVETAQKVGSRHGSPVILQIDAVQMTTDGFKFYKSNNEVYLTDQIPTTYITIKK